jgi:hypothetical protein
MSQKALIFIIVLVVLRCCESGVTTSRDEHRLFRNRVLRGIIEPKEDEVTGGRRNFHNDYLHNLYASPNIIRIT